MANLATPTGKKRSGPATTTRFCFISCYGFWRMHPFHINETVFGNILHAKTKAPLNLIGNVVDFSCAWSSTYECADTRLQTLFICTRTQKRQAVDAAYILPCSAQTVRTFLTNPRQTVSSTADANRPCPAKNHMSGVLSLA